MDRKPLRKVAKTKIKIRANSGLAYRIYLNKRRSEEVPPSIKRRTWSGEVNKRRPRISAAAAVRRLVEYCLLC